MTCDKETIGRFLENGLSQAEARELETHLDSCERCRKMVTESAAAGEWWDEARESLGDEDIGQADLAETLSFLNPSDNPRMMGRFGGYEIAGLIGQGGMGIVLKGFDESLNRYAAIKVLAPQLATRGSARNRFAREAQAAAAVVHDNVIAIHGVSEAAGLPFLVMPYVRGESLQKRIDRDGSMSATEIVRIAHQIASGLSAAHKQGLVHRDIKPANILLPQGVQRVLITDFGLARAVDDSNLTGTGTIAGTPEFMSPEQARGETVDIRSDLFSLGTVIYAMCTGRNPFRAANPFGVLRRIIEDEPRDIRELNPEIPVWLQGIVSRLHAKSPEDRFQSASELAELLEKCLAHLQNPSVKLPEGLRTANESSESWWRWQTAAVVLVMAGIGFWGLGSWALGFPGWSPDHINPVPQQVSERDKLNPVDSTPQRPLDLVANTGQELLQEIQDNEDLDSRVRDELNRLSNLLAQEQEEGDFVSALALEHEILARLRTHDKDFGRLNELRKKMIADRLRGDHEGADTSIQEMKTIERTLDSRYAKLERIEAMQEKVKRQVNPLLELAMSHFQAGRDAQGLQERETAEKMIRQLEKEYRDESQVIAETVAVDASDELLDARIAFHKATNNLSQAKSVYDHSEKLAEKGFVTQQQVEADKSAVRIAELELEKASNRLRRLVPKEFENNQAPEGFGDREVKQTLYGIELFQGRTEADTKARIKSTIEEFQPQLDKLQKSLGNDHDRVKKFAAQIDHWKQLLADLESNKERDQ